MSAIRAAVARLAAAGLAAATLVVALPSAAHAASPVDGAGSTWSQIAVDQWRADVASQGLTVNYQGVGSSAGRQFYINGQVDFAVSEIPFQDGSAGGTNEIEAAKRRPYAYLPIVAGGTSFMYHLVVNGQRVTDLRLSPATVARIFTGAITNWNHAEIARENPNRRLPNLAIKPVIRSDGSGTSAQFTAFMASQTPDVWRAFCQRVGLGSSCPATSLYPPFPGSAAQQFSDGVANFVAAPYNNGAITYVEYGYAKERGFPVASVLNKAGYFVQPTAQAVAIALQGARFNPDGTQNLGNVYTFPDNRAYPVSSYSYMIVPTSVTDRFSREEGTTLGRFILYFLCAGQQKAEQLGYSPLPKVLVENGFAAVRKIPGAPAPPPIAQCANPTITGNFITGASPPPPDDAKNTPGTTAPGSSGSGGGSGSGSGGGTGAGTGSGAGGDGTVVDGGVGVGDGGLGGDVVGDGSGAIAASVRIPTDDEPLPLAVYVAAVLVVLAGVFGPPTLAAVMRRRKEIA
ncbi:MAG TPA: phosphate ABC transporter substrate-binding protein PstS [Acidimicrobiia bacterium]|nr:phosphate ABC transporter substrate-binding protein PstS [Acidimicrobiia bacterium]